MRALFTSKVGDGAGGGALVALGRWSNVVGRYVFFHRALTSVAGLCI